MSDFLKLKKTLFFICLSVLTFVSVVLLDDWLIDHIGYGIIIVVSVCLVLSWLWASYQLARKNLSKGSVGLLSVFVALVFGMAYLIHLDRVSAEMEFVAKYESVLPDLRKCACTNKECSVFTRFVKEGSGWYRGTISEGFTSFGVLYRNLEQHYDVRASGLLFNKKLQQEYGQCKPASTGSMSVSPDPDQ